MGEEAAATGAVVVALIVAAAGLVAGAMTFITLGL